MVKKWGVRWFLSCLGVCLAFSTFSRETRTPIQKEHASLHIAVASNFGPTLNAILSAFPQKSQIKVSAASTGKHYAQILHGAPFHLFLAADKARPLLLAQQAHTATKPFLYATGQLALVSSEPLDWPKTTEKLNSGSGFLALANPKLAPYGVAAQSWLIQKKLWSSMQKRLLKGENVNQAFHFFASGNAQMALVSMAQVVAYGLPENQYYLIPKLNYPAIEQYGIGLREHPLLDSFLTHLSSTASFNLMSQHGYLLP